MIDIHYIVLDLEWNQNPYEKEKEKKLLPFEIVEIGAQKLNDKLEITDSFQCIITPRVYPKLNPYVQMVVPVTPAELSKGTDFKTAAEAFIKWCEKDAVFCTWGCMDLTELQRNMKYFGVENPFTKPLIFYDIQKLFSICYDNGKTRISLENAVDYLKIPKDIPFHRAEADTYYTARVMQTIEPECIGKNYSIDLFQNPKNRAEEIYAVFDNYSKFVSREFNSKEQVMRDGVVTATRCCKCGRNLRKKIRWFSINGKIYYSLMYCENDGWIKGKIRMKKTDEDKFFAVRTIKVTDEEGAALIHAKQEEVRKKRRIKRHKED